MATDALAVAADALVLLGLAVTTLGVAGMFRMPDVYTELHAASKAVVLGVVAFLVASLAARDGAVTSRAILIAGFLILTAPVAAHVIARAGWSRHEPMRTPGALDESGRRLAPDATDDRESPERPPTP